MTTPEKSSTSNPGPSPDPLPYVYQELVARVTGLRAYAVYNTLTGDLAQLYICQITPAQRKGIPQLPSYTITPADFKELLRIARERGVLVEG